MQIAPTIEPGSGVAGVAFNLEREFRAAGVEVERYTSADAGRPLGGSGGGPAIVTHLERARNVVWFSTVGTRRARSFLAARPDAISICHNDVMTGDVYVNHGLLQEAMRARGNFAWRMLRNPVHLYTALRDRIRYRSRRHRAVVALTSRESELLVEEYGRVRAPIRVIPNGVDVERFRPPTAEERASARAAVDIPDDRTVAVFVGHEFDRKGLPIAIEALGGAPSVTLLVVGGTDDMIRRARARARRVGVADRVVFVGTHPDPVPFLWAADALVLPSAYEANALVVLEALACGLPVVSTRVGFAPDILVDGENGYLVDRDPASVAARLDALDWRGPRTVADWHARARATAERYSWPAIAREYLALVDELRSAPEPHPRGPLRIVHAIRSDGFSGVEQFVLRLARAQAADGHRVLVVGGDTARMRGALAGSGVAHVPAVRTVDVTRALLRHARGADVVNTHMTAADVGAVAALALVLRPRRPVVVATRHFAKARGSIGPVPIAALVGRVIDAQLAISDVVADAVDGDSTVVHPGLDPRPDVDAADRERIVLMAQRLQPEKHTEVGIRAFAESGIASEGWRMQVAGTGPERDALERLAASLGIADAVEFLGFRTDLPELMDRSGMLVASCPFEHFGLTVLESMASGLPVVAAGAAGHLDMLDGLDPRALFAPDDIGAAASALRSLAGDAEGRAALGTAERERQRRDFSMRAQVDATEAVYRSVR
ncbi:glycosyltransferase family 4 protein [Agromyces rhizosphaerae]|uniref:glycosyltransferase family 4 protein n=1 Tax=Agromyces rhizosphaerae TaxID=88374 RepID=UPI0024935EF2|nr:glycosyltransferase [Agromyces rhizosphaerae]